MMLPDDSSHLVLVGRNGSGKTQALGWHLSMRSFDAMPWIIFNSKNDKLLNKIGAIELRAGERIPRDPGLYMYRPMPEDEWQDDILMQAWARENVGIVIDELYNMPRGGRSMALRTILTQGRSKFCPLIMCVQRPVNVDRSTWSECNYAQVFYLSNAKDRATIETDMTPVEELPWKSVMQYHSIYMDMREGKIAVLRPVPSESDILSTYRQRLQALPQHVEASHRWI